MVTKTIEEEFKNQKKLQFDDDFIREVILGLHISSKVKVDILYIVLKKQIHLINKSKKKKNLKIFLCYKGVTIENQQHCL